MSTPATTSSHWYTLNLRKGDTHIELTAEDSAFMELQLRQWFSVLGIPVALPPVTPSQSAAVSPEPKATATEKPPLVAEAQPVVAKPTHLSNVTLPGEAPKPSLADSLPTIASPASLDDEHPVQSAHLQPDPLEERMEGGVSQEDIAELSPSPMAEPELAPITYDDPAIVDSSSASPSSLADRHTPPVADDDFERVMSTLMADLHVEDDMGPLNTAAAEAVVDIAEDDGSAALLGGPLTTDENREAYQQAVATPPQKVAVADVQMPLTSASIATAEAPPSLSEAFRSICDTTGAATPEDHLLISAFTLTTRSETPRFSLAKLNSLIQDANEPSINHSVLEVALSKGLLVMVPDLTGTAQATEYELTAHGRSTVETFL